MRREPRPIADLVGGAIDQACRRRGFASSELVTLWPELVGAGIAAGCRPEKLVWPRRRGEAGEGEPATLIVSSDGPTALVLTHAGPQLVERLNAFLGWKAIGRIRIEQTFRPPPPPRPAPRTALDPAETAAVKRSAAGIADGGLRDAVERLGRAVLSACHPTASDPLPPPQVRPNPASPSSRPETAAAGRAVPAHRGVPS
jgi:hypothetical protein